ncbi:MAG: hypothetical protein M3Q52_00685 [Pseudomonadota bacterium]|nr:hypothetical protein [Pseudomonadota bacterium]
MIAALTTVVFLATIVMIAGGAAIMIEERGAAVVAALKGRSLLAVSPLAFTEMRVNQRVRVRQPRPMRAEPRLRAAA